MGKTKFLDYNGLSKLVEKIKNTYVNKNEQYEANLKWGGGNFAGSFGPIDAAMVPELGANRFAFGDPKGITIEYSNDGGSTWRDYGATDLQKLRLTSTGDGFVIGKTKSSTPANDMLRITFDTTTNNGISCYTILNKFVIYISTSGSQGCYCTIQKAKYNSSNNFEDVVTRVDIAGWSGYNVINTKSIITSQGSDRPDGYSKIRFIFGCSNTNENSTGLQIISIFAFGGVGWHTPSNMAKNGHLYRYDEKQNAIFPAKVTANSFIGPLNGNSTSASKLNTGTTGTSTKPVYFNNGVPATCTYELNKTVPSNAVFTDKNVYQVFDNATTSFLPLLLSPLAEDTKTDEVHQTTNAKYNFAIVAVPSEGKIKATIFDGTTFTGNAATASRATYADKYSYNGVDRDFVYDVVDGGNHYIRCKDATIIRANGTNLNKYEFIINSDGKGGCYIYDGANAKGTTWSPDGIAFEKAPANSLVAANGTFITAITDPEIQTEIDKAITL